MSSCVEAHVLARIASAPVVEEPFAHCVVDGVFPEDFYEDLIDHWPRDEDLLPLAETGRVTGNYSRERLAVPLTEKALARLPQGMRRFWTEGVARWLNGQDFLRALARKFPAYLPGETSFAMRGDGLIVSDRTSFAIGPHTDAPHRLVTLLFYVPEDAAFRSYGTSFYAPRDPAFRCAGGPHYKPEYFRLVKTLEFLPNRLVMFPKSDRCFHGVEPVDLPGIDRRLLIYDVRRI